MTMQTCLEIDDSLQILVKLSFYVAMLKKKQDICISIEQIIDANHWNVEEKYTSMKCLLTKNTRRESSYLDQCIHTALSVTYRKA